jgi:glycosyltransferase involved in cell wall biosynthesis
MNATSYKTLRARPPRILHFIESGGMYGAERVILNLAVATRDIGRYEPIIGCICQRSDEHPALTVAARSVGIAAKCLVMRNRWLFIDLPHAAREIRAMGIDVIHSHGYKPSVYASLVGKILNIPVMATCHLWYVDETAPLKTRAMIALERRLYRGFPAVVAVSDNIRAVLLSSGVDSSRTTVIPNGIPLSGYGTESPTSIASIGRDRSRVPGAAFCVVNIARLTAQKAQADLITAASTLTTTVPGLKVLIVGEGELRTALENQVVELGLKDTVQLLGFRDDVRDLLKGADVFALPSRDEGMPMSLLEAVASNVPAIVTAVGDIPKLIRHGETGIVVELGRPDDLAAAIRHLYDDPEAAKGMASRARSSLMASYSSEQMYARYSTIYERLLG